MPSIKKYKAKFFNPNGTFHSSKKIDISKKKFSHNKGKYNIKPNASYLKLQGLIWDTYHFYYIIGHPDPLIFDGKLEKKYRPYVDAEQYETIIETKVVRDANRMDEKNPLANIKIQHILLILGGIGLLIYLMQGGSLI